MKQISNIIIQKKQIYLVGLVFSGFFGYSIRASLIKRYFFEMKKCFFEFLKSIFFFSFFEKMEIITNFFEFRKRNFYFPFFKEEFNFLFIEHLVCLFFKVYFAVSGKKDFFLKRVVSFFFWFINMVSLDVVEESSSSCCLPGVGLVVKESKVFPLLSEVESDRVVVCINKKVSFFQAVSLFCELIWNLNFLNFFFFENKNFFLFLGKILQSIVFFFDSLNSGFSFCLKTKRAEARIKKMRLFFCKKKDGVFYNDLVASKKVFLFKR